MSDRPNTANWNTPIDGFTTARRHLPHLELPGGYYFTTTCTKLRRELTLSHRDIVLAALQFMDGKKYQLDVAVVMPDHFHMMLHPLQKDAHGDYALREIFHSIKSFTANKIGGRVWQDENFDHLIRNEKDYYEKLQYILYNPVKAGLVASPWEYKLLYWIGRGNEIG